MIENILGLVVWIVFGTQHHEPALELINVHGKILGKDYNPSLSTCTLILYIYHPVAVWVHITL